MAAVLVAALLAAYSNCWRVPFQFDDHDNIAKHQAIRTLIVPSDVTNGHTRRPVGRWSLWLNYQWGGLDVVGYHVVNVAIHAAAALALFGLIRRSLLLPGIDERLARRADWVALACALLWSLHPLQTQSVTYLIQRFESLMGLFFLLSLYCLVRSQTAKRPAWWLAGMVVCTSLSIGSKEVGMMAPLVALLYDRVFLSPSWRHLIRRHGLAYLAMVPAMVWFVWAMRTVVSGEVRYSANLTSWEYFRSQPGVILHYLRLTAWPDVLVLDYNWPVTNSWLQIAIPGCALIVALLASFVALWRWPAIGFLGLSFFLILAPTSSVVPITDLAFEHRMYLPLASIVVLVVLAGWSIVERFAQQRQLAERIALAAIVVVALGLGWRTHRRNVDWASPLSLWETNVRDNPNSRRGWGNYSLALVGLNRSAEAIPAAKRCIALRPTDPWTHAVLGAALLNSGRVAEALSEYQEADRLRADYIYAAIGQGKCYWELKQLAQAEQHFRRAVTINSEDADASDGLARVLVELGRPDEAIPFFQAACQSDLLEPIFPLNFGSFHARRKEFDQAIPLFRESIRRKPEYAQAHLQLALACLESGNLPAASKAVVSLLRLKPNSQAGRELLQRIDAAQRGLAGGNS